MLLNLIFQEFFSVLLVNAFYPYLFSFLSKFLSHLANIQTKISFQLMWGTDISYVVLYRSLNLVAS